MVDWAVRGSSEFDKSCDFHFAEFKAKRLAINANPSGARKAVKDYNQSSAEFRKLLQLIDDLEEKKILPGKLLTFVQNDAKGRPLYSLIHGNWRCLYAVDRQKRTCTAIKIESMSDALRNVELNRHSYGEKLADIQ